MKTKFCIGQHVYFIISGRFIKEAVVVSSSSWFVTILFKKEEECMEYIVEVVAKGYCRVEAKNETAAEQIAENLEFEDFIWDEFETKTLRGDKNYA